MSVLLAPHIMNVLYACSIALKMFFGEPLATVDAKAAARFYRKSPERYRLQPEEKKSWMRCRVRDVEDRCDFLVLRGEESDVMREGAVRFSGKQWLFILEYFEQRRLLLSEYYVNLSDIRTHCDRLRIEGRPFTPIDPTFQTFAEDIKDVEDMKDEMRMKTGQCPFCTPSSK